MNNNLLSKMFAVDENIDHRAIFPARIINGKFYIILSKQNFIVTETPTSIVLEEI